MKNLIERNYKSIVKRGLIKRDTYHVDFMHKLNEEVSEVKNEIIQPIDLDRLAGELCDVIGVCFNWMNHYGINVEEQLNKMITKNENRSN